MNIKAAYGFSLITILLIFNFSFGQEIVFSTSDLKEKKGNIFENLRNPSASNGLKVSEIDGHLIIDYTKRYYLYSFVFNSDFQLKQELSRRMESSSYINFLESFGPIENRHFVFRGFNKDELFFYNIEKEEEGTFVKIKKSEFIGAFTAQNKFFHIGYDKRKASLIFTSFDQNLNSKSDEILLRDFMNVSDQSVLKSFEKIFSNERFEEINNYQLNTIEEISRRNKFFVSGKKLIFLINPQLDKSERLDNYAVTVDLETFKLETKKLIDTLSKENYDKKQQSNSYYFDDKVFCVNGNRNEFTISVFELNSKKVFYSKKFDSASFFDLNSNNLFDIDLKNIFRNPNKMSIEQKLKQIFKLNVGIKVNQTKNDYYIIVGGIEKKSGFSTSTLGGSPFSDKTIFLHGFYSFEFEKSIKLTLDKSSSKISKSNEVHPYQKIETFRKDNFFKGIGMLNGPTKKLPRTEVQFKYGDAYYLAYYSDYEEKYIIRKFN